MKAALVEISTSHEECIYSQLEFMKASGWEVVLFLHQKLQPQVLDYEARTDGVIYLDPPEKGFGRISFSYDLACELARFDRVIFNTASSSKIIRNTALFLKFARVGCYGVLHDTKRLKGSFTQKLIRTKVKKYWVLNDVLLKDREIRKTPENFESFYPIYFPKYKTVPVKKDPGKIWVCIPGRIEDERRDYTLLFNALDNGTLSSKITLIFLGKFNPDLPLGRYIQQQLERLGLENRTMVFSSFLSNPEFHAYLKNSDYIMPLLRTDKRYNQEKISGSINLAFAYQKKLLCRKEYSDVKDFQERSVFYSENDLLNCLNTLKPVEDFSDMDRPPKWEFDFQRKKYVNFLQG